MKTEHTTFVGLLVALTLTGGFALYFVGRWMPLPGSKLLVLAPFLALVMFVAIIRLQSVWSMTLVSVVLAALMSAINPVMSLAIVSAGLISDLLARLLPLLGGTGLRSCLSAALYPMSAFLLGVFATNYITGRALFGAVGVFPLFAGALLGYILGLAGALLGRKIMPRILLGDKANWAQDIGCCSEVRSPTNQGNSE